MGIHRAQVFKGGIQGGPIFFSGLTYLLVIPCHMLIGQLMRVQAKTLWKVFFCNAIIIFYGVNRFDGSFWASFGDKIKMLHI